MSAFMNKHLHENLLLFLCSSFKSFKSTKIEFASVPILSVRSRSQVVWAHEVFLQMTSVQVLQKYYASITNKTPNLVTFA